MSCAVLDAVRRHYRDLVGYVGPATRSEINIHVEGNERRLWESCLYSEHCISKQALIGIATGHVDDNPPDADGHSCTDLQQFQPNRVTLGSLQLSVGQSDLSQL